jgi:hypothetical protein
MPDLDLDPQEYRVTKGFRKEPFIQWRNAILFFAALALIYFVLVPAKGLIENGIDPYVRGAVELVWPDSREPQSRS